MHRVSRRRVAHQIAELAKDPSPDVKLQVAIAAGKIEGLDPVPVLLDVLSQAGDDPLIPAIVWQNLQPLVDRPGRRNLEPHRRWPRIARMSPAYGKFLPHLVERVLEGSSPDPAACGDCSKWSLTAMAPTCPPRKTVWFC